MSINKPMKGTRYNGSSLKELRKKFYLVGDEFTYKEFKAKVNRAKVFGEYDEGQIRGFIARAEELKMIECIESPDDPTETRYKRDGSFRSRKKA